MPRTARAIGDSGIYHVMLRGINRQRIQEEVLTPPVILLTTDVKICLPAVENSAYRVMQNSAYRVMSKSAYRPM